MVVLGKFQIIQFRDKRSKNAGKFQIIQFRDKRSKNLVQIGIKT
jgi:hypothetical protein